MIRTGKIGLEYDGDDSTLTCPRCGGSYLHHRSGVFYERGEDDESTVKITVGDFESNMVVVPSKSSGNPSRRRDGFVMRFSCESCSKSEPDLELSIAQHKGQTLISWGYQPEEN